jgi:hypothetical protein
MMFFISIPLWIKVGFPYSIVKDGPVGGNLKFIRKNKLIILLTNEVG